MFRSKKKSIQEDSLQLEIERLKLAFSDKEEQDQDV